MTSLRRVLVVGGGPAGLYAAALLKKVYPKLDVRVVERNPKDATYGWGVVFSEQTLESLRDADPETHRAIASQFARWDAIDVKYGKEENRCHGHSFTGIARTTLLRILQDRCAELGVKVAYECELGAAEGLGEYDLVIAADGANSQLRQRRAEAFGTTLQRTERKYVWLGTSFRTDSMYYLFKDTPHGLFLATMYPFTEELSTCVFECDADTWTRAGLDRVDEEGTIAFAHAIFPEFEGKRLLSNRSLWLNFVTIRNRSWHHENVVLMGDAAHTAHYSIGSGTKMAMEDSIGLVQALREERSLEAAFVYYERGREPVIEATQEAGQQSYDWFVDLDRYSAMRPLQFTFNLLTRSGRIGYDNLRVRDSAFVERVDRWYAAPSSERPPLVAPPPAFNPCSLRGLRLDNRLAMAVRRDAVSPVAAATSGVSLVLSEVTAVSSLGRISAGDPVVTDATPAALLDAVHAAGARAGLRLVHAGPRGSTQDRRHGRDRPLRQGAWPLVAASPAAYAPGMPVASELDRQGMDAVRDDFAAAARHAAELGFDLLHLQFGAGYLVGTFLSPLTNHRSDAYGGCLENRLRFPLEVLAAVRSAWPDERPLAVAFTADDLARGGISRADAVAVAAALAEAGCDLIEPQAGQTLLGDRPSYSRYYLAPLCEAIRNLAAVTVLAHGRVSSMDEANMLLAGGRADLCLMDLRTA